MDLFSPLRLLSTLILVLPLTVVLPAEEPELWCAQNGYHITSLQTGNTLYRGQSLRTDKFEDWQTKLWAAPYGNWEHRPADADSAGFQANTFGVMAGFHRRRKSRLTWGWGAGGSWVSACSDRGSGYKNISAFKTILDAALEETDWRLQVTTGYGHNSQVIERDGFSGQYGGNNSASQWGIRTEFQLKLGTGLFAIEPFAGFDCVSFLESGYGEHRISGTGQSQSFGKLSENSLASTLGLRYRWRQTGQLVVWRPELTAAWFHEFGSDRIFRSSQLDPFPTFYTFPDGQRPRDHLLVGIGIVGHLGSTMDVFARYAVDIAGDDTTHAILCGTHWKF